MFQFFEVRQQGQSLAVMFPTPLYMKSLENTNIVTPSVEITLSAT